MNLITQNELLKMRCKFEKVVFLKKSTKTFNCPWRKQSQWRILVRNDDGMSHIQIDQSIASIELITFLRWISFDIFFSLLVLLMKLLWYSHAFNEWKINSSWREEKLNRDVLLKLATLFSHRKSYHHTYNYTLPYIML